MQAISGGGCAAAVRSGASSSGSWDGLEEIDILILLTGTGSIARGIERSASGMCRGSSPVGSGQVPTMSSSLTITTEMPRDGLR